MARVTRRLIAGASVVVAVAVAGVVPVASAATGGHGCAKRNAVKAVFPAAKTIGFTRRGPVKFQGARQPIWPGRCVGWWVEYENIGPDGIVESYVDVGVTLYRTPAHTLAPLREPLQGLVRDMADGGKMNLGDGFVSSAIGNVFIITTSSELPVDTNGRPDYAEGSDISATALMKIHRAIHAKVLQLR